MRNGSSMTRLDCALARGLGAGEAQRTQRHHAVPDLCGEGQRRPVLGLQLTALKWEECREGQEAVRRHGDT